MTTHRGHNEGSIFERKDGAGNVTGYRAQVSLPDGSRRSFSGKTKAEARRKMEQAKVDRAQGRLGPNRRQTLAEFLDGWLSGREKSLKPRAYDSCELNTRRIKPLLGKIRIDSLKAAQIQDCYNQLGARLSPRSVRQVHETLHKALADAVRLDLIPRNVSDAVTLPRISKDERPWYTSEELERLFATTEGDRFHALWIVLATEGLRMGEALGLRWADVDWTRGTLSVNRALQRQRNKKGLVFVEPKTGRSRRTVFLTDTARHALLAHRDRQEFARNRARDLWQEQDLVFTTEIGTPLEQGRAHTPWTQACAAADVPRYRLHDLRHTCATRLIRAGMDSHRVAGVLGHSSTDLVWRTYGHHTPPSHTEADKLMDALYEQHFKGV